MKNLISNNTANNAIEAKIIVDGFLSSLTDKQCADLAFRSIENDAMHTMPFRISYAIGSSSFYYGSECKRFCTDVISNTLFNRGFKYIRETKTYKILNQSNGQFTLAKTIAEISRMLDAPVGLVKLHIDKPVQLNGYQITTL
jgi:hypothetical protein